jgi:hypothetical protein
MYAENAPTIRSLAIISFDHQGLFASEGLDRRCRYLESQLSGQSRAEMLVDIERLEILLSRWLQDVRRRRRSGGYAPPFAVLEQGHLGLRPGEAELTMVTGQSARAVVLHQVPQTFGYAVLREPLYLFIFILRASDVLVSLR